MVEFTQSLQRLLDLGLIPLLSCSCFLVGVGHGDGGMESSVGSLGTRSDRSGSVGSRPRTLWSCSVTRRSRKDSASRKTPKIKLGFGQNHRDDHKGPASTVCSELSDSQTSIVKLIRRDRSDQS